jgi:AcrR family transcriptional regulator
MARPLTRQARKEQTRAAIITAAAKLFARDGIEATSLDAIASEIGLTKGAIYSTFASKDELVEAVAIANSLTVNDDLLFDASVPMKEVLRRLAAELMAARKKITRDQYVLFLELFMYERRHGSWGKKMADENLAAFEADARRLESAMKERGERLSVPAAEVFTAVNALATGVVLQLERDPNSLSTESVVKMFESLAE